MPAMEQRGRRVEQLVDQVLKRKFSVDHAKLAAQFAASGNDKDKTTRLSEGLARVHDIIRFGSHTDLSPVHGLLQSCLPPDNASDLGIIAEAAELIGVLHAARKHERGYVNMVKVEAERAIKWLQADDRFDSRRLAGTLILSSLARNTPNVFYECILNSAQHVNFVEVLLSNLFSTKQQIREGCVQVLHECLALLVNREGQTRDRWYNAIVTTVEVGLSRERIEATHGAVLAVGELLGSRSNQRGYRSLIRVCELLNPVWDTKNSMIQHALINALPRIFRALAAFRGTLGATETERATFFKERSFDYIQRCIIKDRGRQQAFSALGDVVGDVSSRGQFNLTLWFCVNTSKLFQERKIKGSGVVEAALLCLSRIAPFVDPGNLKQGPPFWSLLDALCELGLSKGLVEALRVIVLHHPATRMQVTQFLVKRINEILARNVGSNVADIRGDEVLLALETLGTFEFGEAVENRDDSPSLHTRLKLALDCAAPFISHPDLTVARAALLACAKQLGPAVPLDSLLEQDEDSVAVAVSADTDDFWDVAAARDGDDRRERHKTRDAQLIFKLMFIMLRVSVSSEPFELRLAALCSVDQPSLDHYLAQDEHQPFLLATLHDDVLEAKVTGLSIIGRLFTLNPDLYLPSLQAMLIQLITVLLSRDSADAAVAHHENDEVEKLVLLSSFLRHVPWLCVVYATSIVQIITQRLDSPIGPTTLPLCALIADSAVVMSSATSDIQCRLLSSLIRFTRDGVSSEVRKGALRALGLVAQAAAKLPCSLDKGELYTVLDAALSSNTDQALRSETLRVLGTLPLERAAGLGLARPGFASAGTSDAPDEDGGELVLDELQMHAKKGTDSYFLAAALNALIKIASDVTQSVHHIAAVQAMLVVLEYHTIEVQKLYISRVVRAIVRMVETANRAGLTDIVNYILGDLVKVIRISKRNLTESDVRAVVTVVLGVFRPSDTMFYYVEVINNELGENFRPYFPQFLRELRKSIVTYQEPEIVIGALALIASFRGNLDGWLHEIVTPITKLIDGADVDVSVRVAAVQCLVDVSHYTSLRDCGVVLFHPLARALDTTPEVQAVAMELLETLLTHMGQNYQLFGFVKIIGEIVARHKIQADGYDRVVRSLMSGVPLPTPPEQTQWRSRSASRSSSIVSPPLLAVDHKLLREAWTVSKDPSAEDWAEWLKRFSCALLKTSPYPALRACSLLAEFLPAVARQLFNAAFVSCWDHLFAEDQDELVLVIEQALGNEQSTNKDVRLILLNLAEFMEFMNRGRLLVSENILAYSAFVGGAYSKSLHYKERLLAQQTVAEPVKQADGVRHRSSSIPQADSSDSVPSAILSTIIDIIELNNALKLPSAAYGCMKAVGNFPRVSSALSQKIARTATSSLTQWDQVLLRYRQQTASLDPFANTRGYQVISYARCLDKMFQWSQLADIVSESWSSLQTPDRQYTSLLAPMACAAAIHTGDWSSLSQYVGHVIEKDQQYMYRSVIAIYERRYRDAVHYVHASRRHMPIVSEGGNVTHSQLTHAQVLCSLEEIITYIQNTNDRRRRKLRAMWDNRIKALSESTGLCHMVARLTELAVSPLELCSAMIHFTRRCHYEEVPTVASSIMSDMLKCNLDTGPADWMASPMVTYEWIKLGWQKDDNGDTALQRLVTFTSKLATQRGDVRTDESNDHLLARSYRRLGLWKHDLAGSTLAPAAVEEILELHEKAISCDEGWDRAWLWWALANCRMLDAEVQDKVRGLTDLSFVVSALKGFFKAIAHGSGQSLEHGLRLIRLWFRYGGEPVVQTAIFEGLASTSIDSWLRVIPQFIARLETPNLLVRESVYKILSDIGRQHPQALVMPLLVLSQSQRQQLGVAAEMLAQMRRHSAELIEQACLVTSELVRVALLWHELWHTSLSTASTLFFDNLDAEGMIALMQPLHDSLRKPETLNEIAFSHAFGTELSMAESLVKEFQATRDLRCMSRAWSYYHDVFRGTWRMLPRLTVLELEDVSPRLLKLPRSVMSVPGTYAAGAPLVTITSFDSTLQVIASKQRPRKIGLRGSDGKRYQYLLKSQEDLRVDERVMSFFELVNSFLEWSPILRYSVTPLAERSGLIGWVDNCEMLHSLMVQSRKRKNMVLHAEHMYIRQMAPQTTDAEGKGTDEGFDKLQVRQKVEIFEAALAKTDGNDLAEMLWQSSPNAEAWLKRRTTYTVSLAVMSMVGYVLGLGDRHPSNIMIERTSGSVLHIDFGDCFEVAQERDLYRERVPFRLTRVLVNAFPVGGIEGLYRCACVDVMHALRSNRDSLMSVLELFLYDPLLEWTHDSAEIGLARISRPSSTIEVRDRTRSNALDMPTVPRSRAGSVTIVEHNDRAKKVISRVQAKLMGQDFVPKRHRKGAPNSGKVEPMDVTLQVDRLIKEATSVENLSQAFMGWCPYW